MLNVWWYIHPIIFFIDCKPQLNTFNLIILVFLNRIKIMQHNTFTIHAECTCNLRWTVLHQYLHGLCTLLWFQNCLATLLKVMLCSHSRVASAWVACIEVRFNTSVGRTMHWGKADIWFHCSNFSVCEMWLPSWHHHNPVLKWAWGGQRAC